MKAKKEIEMGLNLDNCLIEYMLLNKILVSAAQILRNTRPSHVK
jgi:hypothetical protein